MLICYSCYFNSAVFLLCFALRIKQHQLPQHTGMPVDKWHISNCLVIKILLLLFYSHVAKIRWRAEVMMEIIHSLSYPHHEIRLSLKSSYFHIWPRNFLLLWNPNVQYCSLLGYDTMQLPKWLPVWNSLLPPSSDYKSCWECYTLQCHHMVFWPRRPPYMFSLPLWSLMVSNTELQRPSVHKCHHFMQTWYSDQKMLGETYILRKMFQACNFLWNVDTA